MLDGMTELRELDLVAFQLNWMTFGRSDSEQNSDKKPGSRRKRKPDYSELIKLHHAFKGMTKLEQFSFRAITSTTTGFLSWRRHARSDSALRPFVYSHSKDSSVLPLSSTRSLNRPCRVLLSSAGLWSATDPPISSHASTA